MSSGNLDETVIDWRISSEMLSDLKQGLVATFSDSFITQLLDTPREYTSTDRSFIEALVRRIKRLLQFIITK